MKRTNWQIMLRLIVLIRPLLLFMVFAIVLGVLGNIAAMAVSVLGIVGAASIIEGSGISLAAIIALMLTLALLRGFLRYGEQAGNHYIAFKLLALIRDRVFCKLRELSPAKLDRKDKGDLVNIITSDIELLEVFYAHTISPIMIAVIYSSLVVGYIAQLFYNAVYLLFCQLRKSSIVIYAISKHSTSLMITECTNVLS